MTMRKLWISDNARAFHIFPKNKWKKKQTKYVQKPNAIDVSVCVCLADWHLHLIFSAHKRFEQGFEWNNKFPSRRHFVAAAHSVFFLFYFFFFFLFSVGSQAHRAHSPTELLLLHFQLNVRFLGIHKCDFSHFSHRHFRVMQRVSVCSNTIKKRTIFTDRRSHRMDTDCSSSYFLTAQQNCLLTLRCHKRHRRCRRCRRLTYCRSVVVEQIIFGRVLVLHDTVAEFTLLSFAKCIYSSTGCLLAYTIYMYTCTKHWKTHQRQKTIRCRTHMFGSQLDYFAIFFSFVCFSFVFFSFYLTCKRTKQQYHNNNNNKKKN